MCFIFRYFVSIFRLFFLGVVLLILFFSSSFENTFSAGAESIIKYDSSITESTTVNLPKIDDRALPEEKISHIIYSIIEILISLSGMAAVVIMVIAGVQYTISTGDDDMMASAKKKIIWGLSGLMVIIFSYAILLNTVDFFAKPGNAPDTEVSGGGGEEFTPAEKSYLEQWQKNNWTLKDSEKRIIIQKQKEYDAANGTNSLQTYEK